jgi:hypothetical protein
MRSEEVARYLRDNPQFFEEYADMLSQVVIPHPHGGRAISITERQILTLRDKVRQLETRLGDLIRFGEENDGIAEKVHRLATALLAARGGDAVLREIRSHLVEDFAVPHVAMRLWDLRQTGAGIEFQTVSETARGVASGLVQPYCGASQGFEMVRWFGDAGSHVRSLALVPLRDGSRTAGLLVLGSEDPQRFYAEMGTIYLARIGEMASVALVRELS